MGTRALVAFLALSASGCTTTFYGAPKIEGGRVQCERVCAGWKMELAGMVQMGEYSSGCVCQEPGKAVTPQAAAAAGEAAAGVWVRMNDPPQTQPSQSKP